MTRTNGLERLASQYVSERVAKAEIRRDTARKNGLVLAHFARSFGDRPIERLGSHDIERWLMTRSHLAASSRRSELSIVRGFCGWLVKKRVVRRDPTTDIRSPRASRSVPRALQHQAVAEFLATCPDARAQAIAMLMVGAGLRCIEVARLELGDWDRYAETVIVRGKGDHERCLPVPPEVSAALNRYLSEHPASSGPLIRSYTRPSSAIGAAYLSKLVVRWMHAAGIKGSPHDGISAHALRHTSASDVLDKCGDLRTVQRLLGHQQLSSTAVYLRRSHLGALREAMAGRNYLGHPVPTP